MENIVVGGFDNEKPGSGEGLVTKIADLGMSVGFTLSLHVGDPSTNGEGS